MARSEFNYEMFKNFCEGNEAVKIKVIPQMAEELIKRYGYADVANDMLETAADEMSEIYKRKIICHLNGEKPMTYIRAEHIVYDFIIDLLRLFRNNEVDVLWDMLAKSMSDNMKKGGEGND